MKSGLKEFEGDISLKELSTDPATEVGYGQLYAKTDAGLYYKDSGGLVKNISTPAPSGGSGLSSFYDTGWIYRTSWLRTHLGSDPALNVSSDVTHNLGVNLSDLLVKVMISLDGTDHNSFEIGHSVSIASGTMMMDGYGYDIYQINMNNIRIVTASRGATYLTINGGAASLTYQHWYYKVKVYKL